ncbi:MAG: ArdC family protein [Candidatus Kariarchaeaceae archaeon]|jgi:antirestriction protein ArdC
MAYKKFKKYTPEQREAKKQEKIEKSVLPILELLKKGIVPWKKRYQAGTEEPVNPVTGHYYSGGNCFYAWMIGSFVYGNDCRFATAKQWKEVGGYPKKGSKACYFAKPRMYKEDKNDPDSAMIVGGFDYYPVFNYTQINGVDDSLLHETVKPVKNDNTPIESAEEFFGMYDISIINSVQPSYSPKNDIVAMPDMSTFDSAIAYYHTLAHETGHWTGHEDRMNREGIKNVKFGSENYSQEELIAELFSCMVRKHCGIDSELEMEVSAGYIESWISVFENDPKILHTASSQAYSAFEKYLDGSFIGTESKTLSECRETALIAA